METDGIDLGTTSIDEVRLLPEGTGDLIIFGEGSISTGELGNEEVARIRDAILSNRYARLVLYFDEETPEDDRIEDGAD